MHSIFSFTDSGLLPEDNFEERRLTSTDSSSAPSLFASQTAESGRRENSMRVKMVKKGYSTEADQLLKYLVESRDSLFSALVLLG